MIRIASACLAAALLLCTPLPAGPTDAPDGLRSSDAENDADGPLAPRDERLSHDYGPAEATAQLGAGPNWRLWDPQVTQEQYEQRLRTAQRLDTGTITGAENQHLIHMELQLRRIERAAEHNGQLNAAARHTLHRTLGDAGQVIFFQTLRGQRPDLNSAVHKTLRRDELPQEQLAELLDQFVRLAHLHRMLAGPPQTRRKRAALEDEFAHLASQLYQ
jgi:hypothetical protein